MANLPGDLDAGPPQRRLADPGVTLEQQPGWQQGTRGEELTQGRELGLTPDDGVDKSLAAAPRNRGTSPISPPCPRP
jgi:hypothetical protein